MDKLKLIVKILEDKKAADIVEIQVDKRTTIADTFVVATGTSGVHIKAIAGEIEVMLKKEKIYANKVEGYSSGTWILMDYGDIVVHLFTEKTREFYKLEDMWNKLEE